MSGVSTCRFYCMESWPTSKGTDIWSVETRLKSMFCFRGSAVPLAFMCACSEERLVIPYCRRWRHWCLKTKPLMGCGEGLMHISVVMLRHKNLPANKQERINALCGGYTRAEHRPCWPLHCGVADVCPRWQEGGHPLLFTLEPQCKKCRGYGNLPPFLVLCVVRQLLSSVPWSPSWESDFWEFLCYFSFLEHNVPLPMGSFFSYRGKIARISEVTLQRLCSLLMVYTFV